MDLTGKISLSSVGKVYADWREAPVGRVLSFAGRQFGLRHGRIGGESNSAVFALRADFDGHDAMVVLSGNFGIHVPSQKNYMQGMGETLHAVGPAADVTAAFEIGVEDMKVEDVGANPDAGTILERDGEQFIAVSLPDEANRLYRLADGKILLPSHMSMIALGRVTVLRRV